MRKLDSKFMESFRQNATAYDLQFKHEDRWVEEYGFEIKRVKR